MFDKRMSVSTQTTEHLNQQELPTQKTSKDYDRLQIPSHQLLPAINARFTFAGVNSHFWDVNHMAGDMTHMMDTHCLTQSVGPTRSWRIVS